jgi:cyclophilin family peptidyl-prolyl cis-trans isomerase
MTPLPPLARSLPALTVLFLVAALAGCPTPPEEASAPPGPVGGDVPAEALKDPSLANATSPTSFKARFETNEGVFVIEVRREWAPRGADRFYNLVKMGFFDDVRFFRVIDGFMCQFGIHGDPDVNTAWREATIKDDPVVQTNVRGFVTYAKTGEPDSRTTQLFISFGDNSNLDPMGFAPFGQVIEGMEIVDKLYKGYGEGAPRGEGPDQGRLQTEGNAYLATDFPELDYVVKATIVE